MVMIDNATEKQDDFCENDERLRRAYQQLGYAMKHVTLAESKPEQGIRFLIDARDACLRALVLFNQDNSALFVKGYGLAASEFIVIMQRIIDLEEDPVFKAQYADYTLQQVKAFLRHQQNNPL
jgi:hypothetical protein